VNCQGRHPAWNRKCPTYTAEKQIVTIRVKEKVTFSEAKRRHGVAHPSYRDVASRATAASGAEAQAAASSATPNTDSQPGADTRLRDMLDMTVADLLRLLMQLLPTVADAGHSDSAGG
jgi:hypothetical protein